MELPVGAVLEFGLTVSHCHQVAYNALGLAIVLGAVDLGELLALVPQRVDAVRLASLDEGMAVSAFIFLDIVPMGINRSLRNRSDKGTVPARC